MANFAKIFYFVFAVLTIGGGVMGYVSKGSRPSLIAGVVSGLLLLVAGFLLPQRPILAYTLGLIISFVLAGKFIPDFIHKKAIVPGGLMALLSIAGVIVTLLAWYRK